VVILGVILEHLGLLVVVEVAGEVIEVCFFAPLLTINEPDQLLDYVVQWKFEYRTFSLKGPHRTFGLVEIVTKRRVNKNTAN